MITEQCLAAIAFLITQNIVGLIINAVMLGETSLIGPDQPPPLLAGTVRQTVSLIIRLHLHEDGSVQPARGDADLQPARRDRRQEQPAVLHGPHRGSEEEHDHRGHGPVTGELT